MATEYLSFAGWERNVKLSNDFVEVIITLEVGPRIISYRPVQGRSVFKLVREEAGKSKEDVWKIRGGHRLWSAPEDFGKEDSLCYALDNSEVEHSIEDEFTVRVSNLIEKPTKIRREMVVRLEQKSPKITVEHRITNQGDIPLELAPWALSVMAPGGYAILPSHHKASIRKITCPIARSSRGHSPISQMRDFASHGKRFVCIKRSVRRSKSDCVIQKDGPPMWSTIIYL